MARPAPGSLASRTDLRNRLSFFKKRNHHHQAGGSARALGGRSSSVGEVTIEVEVTNNEEQHLSLIHI